MNPIICACGDVFKTKRSYICHILSLGCFDEDMNFKGDKLTEGEKPPRKDFKMNDKLMKSWSKLKPTPALISWLKNNGYSEHEINVLNKYQAWKIRNG